MPPPPFVVQGPRPLSEALPDTSPNGSGCPPGDQCIPGWSGYFASGATFTNISADYIEETPTSTQPCTGNQIAQWAGIGGWYTNNLAQVGTAYNSNAGIPNHGAFSEILPSGPVYMDVTTRAGDENQAIVQHYSTGYEFMFADLTANNSYGYFESSSKYDGSSADAILERPYNGSSWAPLTEFSSPDEFFFVEPNGNPLTDYTHTPVAMVSKQTNDELAHPGSVFGSGEDFYDYYDNCG